MPKVVRCQHCQGNRTVLKEIKPGKWERVTCPACGGSGKITISTI